MPMKGARVLDGKKVADDLLKALEPVVSRIKAKRARAPKLAVLTFGRAPAAELYLKTQLAACRRLGIDELIVRLDPASSQQAAVEAIKRLNDDPTVDAVLLETPLPKHLDRLRLAETLEPNKDAEGIAPLNIARLYAAKSLSSLTDAMMPPTARAIVELAARCRKLAGAEVVVVGRSQIAGRPAAHMLSCLDATVTLCHSKTRSLAAHLKRADVVVSVIGQPRSIRGAQLKRGAAVIDAGINYVGGRLCGDADFASASKSAGWITPVPGGVGPVTTAFLLVNAVACAQKTITRL